MRHRAPRRAATRWIGLLAAGVLVILWSGTNGTRSSWTSGVLANSTNSAATGTLAFTHSYASSSCSLAQRTAGSISCSGSIAPAAAATSSGVSATDSITDDGSVAASQLTSEFRAASCGPVKLANSRNAANPLLARYGTTFHTSGGPMGGGAGYVTLDGQSPGGYGTAIVSQPQPPTGALSAGRVSGVGVWFRASTGGPLFSFGANAANGAGSADRAVYLDAAGRLSAVWNTSGSSIGPSSSSYTDGNWHFAYITFGGVSVLVVGLIPDVQLWVDGVNVASTPLVALSPLSSYGGYWHLGWAPTAVTGLSSAYFTGSLSEFVVLNGGTPPTGGTIGKPASVAAFNTAIASTVTEQWALDDTGTTTYAGTLPVIGSTSPCTMVDVSWTLSGPAGTVVAAGTALSSLANNSWHAVPAPGPGTTQTGTIAASRGASWNAYVAGLRLYTPVEHRISAPTGSAWTATFGWADSAAVFIS